MINANDSLALTAVAVSRMINYSVDKRMGSNRKRTYALVRAFDALLELDSRV